MNIRPMALLSALVLASTTDAQIVTNTFNSSGSFAVPPGVTQVTVQAWGGGGGGATRGTNGVGGGGGGGAYSRGDVSVVPQQSYTVTVGAGGAANAAGQDSWFGTAATLMAKGGNGGTNNSATGAVGGLASASVGTTKFNGGTGGTGSGTNAGGGGSSAGTAAVGGTGGVPAGGVAPAGGGAGGAGRSATQGDGNPGVGHGGAGGGGYRSSSGTRLGGAGLAGRVVVTYTIPPPGPPAKLVFTTPARTTNIDKSSSLITVQLQDTNNNVVPSVGTTTINLSASGTGEFRNSADSGVITNVTIPNGNTEASFRFRAATVGSRTLTVAATGLTSANQAISIVDLPPVAQTFYLPIPEDQLLTSLNTIAAAAVSPVVNYISLAVLSDNTVIYYDQYEGGYEADLSNPADIYSSPGNVDGTQIWGDGDPANGFPPGFPSDLLDSGSVIVLSASVPVPIPGENVYFGGRDKIGASKAISVVRVGWASTSNTLLAGANEIFDTSNWGTLFRAPVGNNIPDATDFQLFEYAGFLVMAGRGGANIQIDADANGTFEIGPIALVEGQSYHVNNGVSVGARVSSDNPVQVDLITGDLGSNYESRFMKLLPVTLWSNSYVTPVSTPSTAGTQTGTDTTVWLYNPGTSNLSVTYRVRTSASNISSTTLTVPGGTQGGFLKQVLPDNYGAAFSATSPFYAVSTTDSNSGNADGTGNQAWDWGFTLVPQSSLSPQVLVGLGIGRDPTSGTNPDENGNPVWVTPIGNGNTPVTIYVDYDADPLTGPLTDPNGFKYDTSVSLRELERAKLYDANDRNQTGMLLYTLTSGVKLAAAWGQDPLVASAGAPGLDMGTGVPPLPLFTATKSSALDADNDQDTFISPGDRLLYTINIANSSRAPVSDMTLADILPPGTTYVPNSTFFTDDANVTVQIADDGAGTAFPLDGAGKLLPDATLAVGKTWKVVFKVLIVPFASLPPGQAQILNQGTATAENSTVPFSVIDPLYGRIGDFVWNDSNGDGIQGGTELGFSGVTVRLYDGSNNLLATQNTQANGSYLFTGLLAGNYQVRFTTPPGFNFSPQNADSLGLAGTVNSDANPSTGFTSVFALAPGEPITYVDAGMRCGDFTITCPPNLTQNCASVNLSTNVTGAATVVSACNCPLTISFSDTTTPVCSGSYVVTRVWTATDNCGSFQQCTQTITVQDTTAPALSGQGGPATIQCPATPSFTAPTALDACDTTPTITFADVTTPGTCPQEYSVTRTWTATDDCGNSSQVSQTITVEDNTAPVLSGQGGPATIQCPATPSFTAPTALDACDTTPTITFADVTTPGTCPQEYSVTRTWTATDDCGNSSQVSQTITVEDTTAPVLSGQGAAATIQCPATPSFTAPTALDACDTTPTITFADVTTPGTCPQEYSVTRTWTATDDCGNSSQVSQTITVEDTTAPVLSGQGAAATIQCPATPSFTAPTALDTCDTTPTITFADVTTPGECPQEYSVTRTWTATDDCGNSSQVSQTITVEDTTAPVLSGQGAAATIQCPAVPSFTAPTALDACDTTPTITFADVTTPGECPQEYSVTRTWTATDDCGNSSQVSQTITVEDTTAPVLSGQGAAATIQCPATPSFTAPTALDACDTTPTITFADVTTPGECPQEYSVTRTWTATDDCGNSSQVSQTITVEDTTAPVLSGQGAAATIQCPATPSFTAPTALDACDTTPTITFADVTTPGECPQEYSVTRTWTATDDCGNSSQVSQTITVEDTTAPVLSGQGGPATIQCPATPSFTAPTALDACDTTPTITFADVTTPGECPEEYSVTRTWTATDDCGNSSQVSQTITVEDTTAPVLSGQGAPATIQCPATPSFTAPTALDACDTTPTITFADVTTPGECPQEYSVTRTWTATDDCGNSSQVSQTITVEDTTAPVLSGQGGPATIQCPATPSFTAPTALDACDTTATITFADVTTPGTCPQEYSVTRTWTATDDCGNSSQVSQTITVEDTTAPVLSGQGAPATIQCPATASFTAPTALDACDTTPTITFADVTTPGECPQEYSVTRTWTATDDCGNSSQVSQTITVEDTTAPVLSGQGGPATIQCPATPSFTAPTALDACDTTATITFADVTTPGTCPQEYSVTRTWTATDDCGNSSQVSQTITVEDTTAPVLSGQGGPATIQCPATPSFTAPTAFDACDTTPTITFADVTTPGECPQEYSVTRTWTATDDCGNSSQVSQTITVEDTTAPVLSGQGAAATIQCPATPSFTAPTALDACDTTPTITFADVTTPGTCPQEYSVTRTWTATDDCGNASQVSQTITVEDTTAPVLSGQGAAATIQCPATPSFTAPTALDACDTTPTITFADVTTPGTCPQEYSVTRTWTATDDCGNSSQVSQTITVEDTTAPVLSGQGAAATIQCPATPSFTAPTALDACDTTPTITFADVTTPGECPQEYSVTRTWTATDDCGNSSQVSQTITVEDTTAPTITCPAPVTVNCISLVPQANPASVTASDLCGTVTVIHVGDTFTGTPCNRIITRTYRATDACGNAVSCTQTITVIDNVRPVQTGFLQDRIFQCLTSLNTFTPVPPTVVDNCDGPLVAPAPTILNDFSPLNCGRTRRYIWTFRDACGNQLRITQTLFVRDTRVPTITCPAPLVLQGDAECKAVLPALVPTVYGDNCGTAGVTLTQSPPAGTVLTGPGSTTVTLTVRDACGNTATCPATVTVNCGTPAIELVKTVYPGHDAGAFCPGAELVISTNNAPVTYCFEVKNTGALNLVNVVLQDNTLGMPAINVGSLAVGQSRMFSADALITANFTNVAQVAGTSVTGVPVSDSDDAAVARIRPQIQIVKTVAYGDNAPCPGQDFIYAVNGQPVTYCFVVTNLGDVPLRQVVITDDDIGMSPIPLGDLAVGQSKPAKISVIASGSLTNTAWAVGLPPVGPPVTDDDPAEILGLGPALKFGKTTYIGHDAGARCPGGDLALINGPNTPVTFCFEVKNTGDVTLYNVDVSDAGLGYNTVVGTLNPGQVVMLHAEAFLNGPVTNVARVTVLPPSGGAFFVDDEAYIDSARPEIRIDKTVAAGYGGYSSCVLNSVETLNLPAPGAVTYCFKVRNTGNTYLNNLAINDLNLGVQEFDMEYVGPDFPLPPGAEAMYMVKAFASSSLINQVQTTAVPTDAQGAGIPGHAGVGDVDQAEVIITP